MHPTKPRLLRRPKRRRPRDGGRTRRWWVATRSSAGWWRARPLWGPADSGSSWRGPWSSESRAGGNLRPRAHPRRDRRAGGDEDDGGLDLNRPRSSFHSDDRSHRRHKRGGWGRGDAARRCARGVGPRRLDAHRAARRAPWAYGGGGGAGARRFALGLLPLHGAGTGRLRGPGARGTPRRGQPWLAPGRRRRGAAVGAPDGARAGDGPRERAWQTKATFSPVNDPPGIMLWPDAARPCPPL